MINHWAVVIFMIALTLYALFFDDFRILWLPPTADNGIYGFDCFVMACFLIEIILHSIADHNYINSFFFWLDLTSTVSLISDIRWIYENSASGRSSASDLAKTTRAARVTRIIRIVRLVRLIRIVKLYKQAKIAQSIQKEKENKELEKKLR